MLVRNGVNLTGLLGGGTKEDWGSGDGSPPVGSRGGVPQKLMLFCESTHNICIKLQQTTVVVVTG